MNYENEKQILTEPTSTVDIRKVADSMDSEELDIRNDREIADTLRRSEEDIKCGRLYRWEDIKRDV